jgi:hypothetical protein
MRWGWPVLLGTLVVVALLLAWADSTVLRPLFPQPQPFLPIRRTELRPPPDLPAFIPGPRRELLFSRLGPAGGLFDFWWFISAGAGLILVALAVLVAVPGRAARAAGRVAPATLPLMLAAGVATALAGLAVTVLLRASFVLVSIVPVAWALLAVGTLFGVAALALALGRWLRPRLGPAMPLVTGLAALLVFLDVGLIPVAGWVLSALVAVAGRGLAVLTRIGSPSGWSLEELNL